MKTNRELVEKTKPLLKDSFVEVFACIFLASALPQIVLSFAPQNVILNIVVTCVSAYIQLGLAVYCIGLYKGDEVNYLTIFSRFNGLKPIVFILILVVVITLGFILLIVPGIILALMYSQVFFILADDPDVGAIEAFNKSEKMMRGHKWQLFMLNLEAAFYFTHLPTLGMALMGVVGILILQRFFPRLPAILTVAVISTAASFLIDYQGMGGAIVNSININGLFSFKIPRFDFNVMGTLFVYAITISLIGFMEAISVAKSMAASTKQRLDVNQELIGQGLSNVTASFFQGYPVSGSFSRSAVNLTAGAVTGFSSVVTAAIVGITILWLTPLLYHLPLATLAAIILMSVASLIHFAPLKHAWKVEKHDGLVGLLTFVMTLVFAPNLENGIAFGVIMSLGLFLYRTMEPNFSELSVEHGSIIASRFADDSNEGCVCPCSQ